jgi:hypothetical protein
MNPESLGAESALVRVHAPRQHRSMPHWEPQEQARKGSAARVLNRTKRNVNSCVAYEVKALGVDVALEAKALGGGGVGVPEALVAVIAPLQKKPRSYGRRHRSWHYGQVHVAVHATNNERRRGQRPLHHDRAVCSSVPLSGSASFLRTFRLG